MLVLATSNRDKAEEIVDFFGKDKIKLYGDIIDEFEIVEDGLTFKENAIIKAKAVYDALSDPLITVLADDSGISVNELDGEPGIYSARYAKLNGSNSSNIELVIGKLKDLGKSESLAYYTCAMATVSRDYIYTAHGYMYGRVITSKHGNNGFGYDPIFIPNGEDNTLGELSKDIKELYSHRMKALTLINFILKG